MAVEGDLQAPVLLLAMPQVQDPFFHRSVVLLVQHDEEGSLGFILNRPTGLLVSEILTGMELEWGGEDDEVARFGGPVQPQLGTVLFSCDAGSESPTATEILPGRAMSQHIGDLETLAKEPPSAFRLFLGYAGWGAGQLVEEILRNDWLTAPPTDRLLFHHEPPSVWDEALRSIEVDPDSLPSWTDQGGDSAAN